MSDTSRTNRENPYIEWQKRYTAATAALISAVIEKTHEAPNAENRIQEAHEHILRVALQRPVLAPGQGNGYLDPKPYVYYGSRTAKPQGRKRSTFNPRPGYVQEIEKYS